MKGFLVIARLYLFLMLLSGRWAIAAPMDVNGMTMFDLGPGVNGFNEAEFKNKTKKNFHDLTISIGPAAGAATTITSVTVGPTADFGAWNVDSSQNGMLEAGENSDSNAGAPNGKLARPQTGPARVGPPPVAAGTAIAPDQTFKLTVKLSGLTANLTKVTLTPTDNMGGQVMAALSGGLDGSLNSYGIFNASAVASTLAGVADINNTGSFVSAVEFFTLQGAPAIVNAFAVDPVTDTNLGGSYAAGLGILTLPSPIAPGQLLGYEVVFPALSSGEFTNFQALPLTIPEPATLALLGIGLACTFAMRRICP